MRILYSPGRSAAAALLACAALVSDAAAQSRPFNQPLTSPVMTPRGRFGAALQVGVRVVAIGAPGDTQRGPDSGAVHVFDRSTVTGAYTLRQILQPMSVSPYDRFGDSVAIFGDLLVVGAKGDDGAAPNAGAVYVFRRNGPNSDFQFIRRIEPPNAGVSDCFGYAVDVTADRIIVGAPRSDIVAYDSGAVYVFDFDAQTNQVTFAEVLVSPTGLAGDGFGTSVAVADSHAMIGVDRADVPGTVGNSGGVMHFVHTPATGFSHTQTLFSSAPSSDAKFGSAIAFEPPRPAAAGVLIVGAPDAKAPNSSSPRGQVTIFEAAVGQPWTEVFSYGTDVTEIGHELGADVALQNGVALAGAPGREQETGSVDLLRRDAQGWFVDRTVQIPGGVPGDRAGGAVGLGNSFPMIGAEDRDGAAGNFIGWAWSVSDLWAPIGELYCAPGVPNSTGRAASLVALGSDVIDDANLVLEAGLMPPFSFGYALVSASDGLVVQPGSSQGILCLGAPIGRYVNFPVQSQNEGRVQITIDLDFIPLPQAPVSAQPGDTWYFQLWYRDANPQVTSNFTDAIAVTVH